jgi:PAS domain S-box-containing protein
MGAQTADLALEILAGKDPNTIAPQLSTSGAYRVDARQLQRWQLSDADLPAGTVVSFREKTLWDEHRYLILSVLAALGLQSAILAYVLVQNRRRRIAERSLAENEERMAFAAASTNTGLWQFETEDKPIWATKHCRSMFGLAENTPLSLHTLRDSVHPDDRGALVRAIRAAASSGHPTDGEFRVVLPSGETRWIAMKSHPSQRENNGRYYVNGIFSDVTTLKAAEGEAELQRTEIARLMRQSVLGELSGTIAHELNQPLTAILSNAETAQDLLGRKTIDLEKIQEIVADIIEEDNRAGEVISRIRKLLRKGKSASEPTDLNQLVESTLRLLHGEIVRRKTSLDVELAANLPTIFGDPVQLQQVLLNVIMNAMEAMSSKAPSQRAINITTRANAKQVEVVIVDSGQGIAAEDQSQLFQPFFTTKEQGLGLGLSLCSTIVKSHGGKLSIENNAGGGATVMIALPTQEALVAA